MPEENISPGQEVFSQDGQRLGSVQQVVGDWFKIDARLAQDYWLHRGRVSHTAEGRLVLDFEARLVDKVRFAAPGAKLVKTADGHELGRIRETLGAYFKVSAPRAQDYWLRTERIASEDADSVTLDFNRDELDTLKESAPGYSTGSGEGGPKFHS